MTGQQRYLSIGVPVVFNALLITVLVLYLNARLDGINERLKE
jgi:hypothetical protein